MYGALELPMMSSKDRFSITTTTTWSGWGIDDAGSAGGAVLDGAVLDGAAPDGRGVAVGVGPPALDGLGGCSADRDADADVVPGRLPTGSPGPPHPAVPATRASVATSGRQAARMRNILSGTLTGRAATRCPGRKPAR